MPPSTTFNLKFAAVLGGGLIALAVATHLLHESQVRAGAGALLAEVDRLEQVNKSSEAADYLERYLLLHPDDRDTRARYALLMTRLGSGPKQKQRAYLILTDALRRDLGRAELRRALVGLCIDLGRFNDARETLAELRQAGVVDATLLRQQAQLDLIDRRPDLAEGWCRKAVEMAPTDPDAAVELADLLRDRLTAPALADAEVERLLVASGGSVPARVAAARYHLRCHRPDQAERALRSPAGDLCSDDADVLLLAAEVAEANRNPDSARRDLQRGTSRYPGDSRFTYALARHDLRAGHRDQALALVGPHLTRSDQSPEDLWRVGNLLIDARDFERAQSLIGQLGATVPKWVSVYLQGRLLIAKGEWGEARLLLERVANTSRVPPAITAQTHLLLGECQARLGNPDAELACYQKAADLDVRSDAARRAFAAALLAQGRADDAVRQYRLLVDHSPDDNVELAKALAQQTLRLPVAARRWDAVEKTLDAAPLARRQEVQLLRAEVLAAQGRRAEARRLAEAERDRDPAQPGPWLVLVRLAERDEAVNDLLDEAERRTGPRADWVVARLRRVTRTGGPDVVRRVGRLQPDVNKLPDAERLRALPALAEAFASAGDLTAAERVWRQLAEIRPNDPEPRLRLFALTLDRGDEQSARLLMTELARLEGEVAPMAAFAEAALHARHARSGDRSALGHARRAINQAIAGRPSWSLARLLDAELRELEGDKLRAIERYEAVLASGQASAEAVRRLVQLLAEQGRYADARGVLAKWPEQTADAGFARADAQLTVLGAPGWDTQARRQGLDAARKSVTNGQADHHDHLWLGELALLAGEPAEAERAFRKARELKGDVLEPWVALVTLLGRTDPKKAEAELDAARTRLPPDQLPSLLAAGYEALGRKKEAGEQFRAMTSARPNDPGVLRNFASFQLRSGESAEAEKTLRRILGVEPKAPAPSLAWARRALAVVLVHRGGFDRLKEAGGLVDPGASGADTTDEDRWIRALVLSAQPGRRKEAIAVLEEVHAPAFALPEARFLLASLYDRDGRWEAAQAEWTQLLRVDDRHPVYLAFSATTLLRLGHTDEAERTVKTLAAVTGETFTTVELQARLAKAKGRPQDAARLVKDHVSSAGVSATLPAANLLEGLGLVSDAEALVRAFAAESKESTASLPLANLLARHGKLADALTIYERAWKTCPAEAVGASCVAALRAGNGTREHAKRVEGWVDSAVAAHPKSVGLLLLRADLYQFQERFGDAVAVYRDILRADPRQVIALNNLAFLTAVRDDKAGEALPLMERALTVAGPIPELLDTRAVVLMRTGRADDAIIDLRRALADSPSGEKQFHLAVAQLNAGRKAASAVARREAIDAGLTRDALHPLERGDWDRLGRELNDR